MKHDTAVSIKGLLGDTRFIALWEYIKEKQDLLVSEILSAQTDPVRREILVRVREIVEHDFLRLPEEIMKSAQANDRTSR